MASLITPFWRLLLVRPSRMPRIIRRGPRPFIAAGVISGLLLLLPLSTGLATGRWMDAGQFAFRLLGIMAVFCLIVSGNRVVVTNDCIGYRIGYIPIRRVHFRDIVASVPAVLAERDWPIALVVFREGRSLPAMVVPLKPWRLEDVKWLLSLPQLKVQPPITGLTMRSSQRLTWP